jgi:glycosyltransferase involved in cell wall biosynthesis
MSIITRALSLEELPPPPIGKTGWPWTEQSELLPERMADSSEWPRISVVTPNYNYGQFLEETIRSVLLQGYPNLEYIIIDGGSTDNSLEIIEKYAQWLAYYLSEKDRGQSDAINKGFNKATGKIYNWLNADDIFCKNTLQEIGQFFRNNSHCNFLTGNGYFFNSKENLEHIEYYVIPREYSFLDLLEYHNDKYLPQPSVFFSKDVFHQLNGLDNSLIYAMDLDMWLRISRLYNLHYLAKCFSKMRHHNDAKTWKNNVTAMAEVRNVIKKYNKYLQPIQKMKNQFGLRHFYALAILRRGFFEYLSGSRLESMKWLCQSILFCPTILCSAFTLKFIIKLMLPKKIFKTKF